MQTLIYRVHRKLLNINALMFEDRLGKEEEELLASWVHHALYWLFLLQQNLYNYIDT